MRQIYEYHPLIGFRFIPETKARIPHEGGGYLVRTNQSGFRSDHLFEKRRRSGMRRILLFGDSFTAGDGVSNGQRYGDYLEKFVPNLEVFNFGLPGTGLDQHYLIYQQYAQSIDHDLLVIAVYIENIRRVGSRYRYFANDVGEHVLYQKPYYALREGRLELLGVPPSKLPIDPNALSEEERRWICMRERFPKLKRLFVRLRQHRLFDDLIVKSGVKDKVLALLGYKPVIEYENPRNAAWLVMQALIAKWITGHPKLVALMPIPIHQYVYGVSNPRSYQMRLRSATERAGGIFIDPLPSRVQYTLEERKTFYFPVDGHMTKAGHEALAKAIAPTISSLLMDSK